MAGTFEVAVQTSGAAAASPICVLQNTAATGGPRLRLKEFGLTTNAATLSQVGLVRSTSLGLVSGTPAAGQPTDDRDPTVPVGSIATGWTTPPSVGSGFLREFVAAAVQGSGVVWTWPADRPLVVSPGGGLVLFNFGSGFASALSAYAVWEE